MLEGLPHAQTHTDTPAASMITLQSFLEEDVLFYGWHYARSFLTELRGRIKIFKLIAEQSFLTPSRSASPLPVAALTSHINLLNGMSALISSTLLPISSTIPPSAEEGRGGIRGNSLNRRRGFSEEMELNKLSRSLNLIQCPGLFSLTVSENLQTGPHIRVVFRGFGQRDHITRRPF